MNREALLEAAERIEGNAWIMRRFLHDPDIGSVEVAIEILGRIGIIEAKLVELRAALTAAGESVPPKHNVHTLGSREPSYRPQGDEAA